jgi:hypothetical protein
MGSATSSGNAMRIEKGQLIAGLAASDVRKLMRKAGQLIGARTVTRVLGFSADDARRLLVELEREGFVVNSDGYWTAATKGYALAAATATRPLRIETAQRLITQVIDRAKSVNRDRTLAYRVQLLVLFGSSASGKVRPNDVDIACKLVARFDGPKQKVSEDRRRRSKVEFANVSEWATWPKLEILKRLKSRSRGISIQELQDWILESTPHRIIFSDVQGS